MLARFMVGFDAPFRHHPACLFRQGFAVVVRVTPAQSHA